MSRKYSYLKGLMVQHDDTLYDLAKALLITERTMYNKFNGASQWGIEEMYKVLDRYGIPYTDMCKVFPKGGVA